MLYVNQSYFSSKVKLFDCCKQSLDWFLHPSIHPAIHQSTSPGTPLTTLDIPVLYKTIGFHPE
jgi:hypothetical protein